MLMKVFYRSSIIYNCMQISLMSLIALYIVFNIIGENNLLAKQTLVNSLVDFRVHLLLVTITIFLLIRLSKWSSYFFAATGISYIVYSSQLMMESFNKLSLLFLSLFITLFFYFYALLKDDLKSSYIKPFFLRNYVGGRPELEINVIVRSQNQKLNGFLGHWDETGCFIYLDESFSKSDKEVWIDFPFENRTFQDKGIVATLTSDKKGVGVRILSTGDLSEEKKFKWKSFIRILQDRGLTPARIK